MLRLRSRRPHFKSSTKRSINGGNVAESVGELDWEVRPGGMLVQKRESERGSLDDEELMTVRVSTSSSTWHGISIGATSTFGDLKKMVCVATGLVPREQRLLFKGKEREDGDHLHMVGVGDGDKVVLLEDPAMKEKKLLAMGRSQAIEI